MARKKPPVTRHKDGTVSVNNIDPEFMQIMLEHARFGCEHLVTLKQVNRGRRSTGWINPEYLKQKKKEHTTLLTATRGNKK